MGFGDATIQRMIEVLQTDHGEITADDIEANRAKLTAIWNLENPTEDLWLRILHVQTFAAAANEPITDSTALRLTLKVFEKTGLLTLAIRDWHKFDEVDQTPANFRIHFTNEIKDYNRLLTAKQAGYQGANMARDTTTEPTPTTAAAATATTPPTTNTHITTSGVNMYYCWTHGLGKNRAHTSASCTNKADGHRDEATATNLMGGNDRIMGPRTNNTRRTPTGTTPRASTPHRPGNRRPTTEPSE
jgi:hypothetical protein